MRVRKKGETKRLWRYEGEKWANIKVQSEEKKISKDSCGTKRHECLRNCEVKVCGVLREDKEWVKSLKKKRKKLTKSVRGFFCFFCSAVLFWIAETTTELSDKLAWRWYVSRVKHRRGGVGFSYLTQTSTLPNATIGTVQQAHRILRNTFFFFNGTLHEDLSLGWVFQLCRLAVAHSVSIARRWSRTGRKK